ncbi:hypothetical protein LTR53_012112 [Teratosphaeriaceae sp. CCFEE 6253]|nr:hypothetical protein LTR53_012112 [Teratosphaeriaceae sp. CCFEE 6253]
MGDASMRPPHYSAAVPASLSTLRRTKDSMSDSGISEDSPPRHRKAQKQPAMSSSPEPPPLRTRQSSPRSISGKFSCDCEPGEVTDSEVLICPGRTHKAPRKYHASCLGEENFPKDETYYCRACVETNSSQPDAASSQPASQASTAQDWEITAILGSREEGGELQYEVRWRSTGGAKHPDQWIPAADVEDGPLLTRFLETGEAASDSDGDVQDHSTEDLDALDVAARNPYWRLYELGHWAMIPKAFREAQGHSALVGCSFEAFRMECSEILAALEPALLRGIMGAGVTRRKRVDPDLRARLAKNRKLSVNRPCIYLLELTDDDGCSLNVSSIRRLIRIAKQYASESPTGADTDKALLIDQVKGDLTPAEKAEVRGGARRYLTKTTRRSLDTFVQNLEREIEDLADEDVLPFMLRDVGYTDNGIRRLDDQHLKHHSSNKLMNLIEAICVCDVALNDRYRMRGGVIYLCCRFAHARFGEILFSILGQSYVATGRGFNGVQAGLSVASNDKWTGADWGEWQVETLNDTPMRQNVDLEIARIAAALDRKAKLEKSIVDIKRDMLQKQVLAVRRKVALQSELLRLQRELLA